MVTRWMRCRNGFNIVIRIYIVFTRFGTVLLSIDVLSTNTIIGFVLGVPVSIIVSTIVDFYVANNIKDCHKTQY